MICDPSQRGRRSRCGRPDHGVARSRTLGVRASGERDRSTFKPGL